MTPRKPSTVAAVRGIILSLAAAVAVALTSLTPLDLEDLGPWGPVVCILL